MLPAYTVAPDPRGGFSLIGPLMEHPLWFRSDVDAVSYGHHQCRSAGGQLVVLGTRGNWLFTEHAAPEDSHTSLYHPQQFPPAGKGAASRHADQKT